MQCAPRFLGRHTKWICLGLLSVALIACNVPNMGEPPAEVGGITIWINGMSAGRTMLPSVDMTIDSYLIELSGPGDPENRNVSGDASSVTIGALQPGDWSVVVTAKNANDTIVGVGESVVTVVAGQTANTTVGIRPAPGHGTFSLSLSWPDGVVAQPSVAAVLHPTDGDSIPLNIPVDESSSPPSAAGESTLAAGYYLLSLQLYDGSTLVWGTVEGVRIVSDHVTGGQVAVTLDDMDNIATGSVNITFDTDLQNPISVTITGQETSLTAGADMNVTAQVDVTPDSIAWYLNGQLFQDQASATLSIGTGLSAGTHRLDAVVRQGDVIGTAGFSFQVAATPGQLKWRYTTEDAVYATVSIGSDGKIYAADAIGAVHAINYDGTAAWSFTPGAFATGPVIGCCNSIYLSSMGGSLYSVSSDGTQEWVFTGQGMDIAPAVDGAQTIYWLVDENALPTAVAVHSNGTEKWRAVLTDSVYVSPVVSAAGTVYLAAGSNLVALGTDGTELWSFATGGPIASTPAIDSDGTVYVGSDSGYLYAVNEDGTEKWALAFGNKVNSDPVIGSDGTIYVGVESAGLQAVGTDGMSGWQYATAGNILGAPAVSAGGTVYAATDTGSLVAVNPDGTERWTYTLSAGAYGSPVVGLDGTVYIGTSDGNVYAIYGDSGGPAASPWPLYQQNLRHTGSRP